MKNTSQSSQPSKKSEFFKSCWDQAYNARQPQDLSWYVSTEFYRGNQHLKVSNGSISKPKTEKIVVNKIYTTVRGVRNYVLRNRPKWSTSPTNGNQTNNSEAVNINKFLDFEFDDLGMKRKLKDVVGHGLIKSIGIGQTLWDSSLDEGKGGIAHNSIDPFDFYPDPKAKIFENAQYVYIAVRKNLSDLKKNKSYDQKVVATLNPDDTVSTSSFKQMLDQQNTNTTTGDKENGAILIKELWYLEGGKVMVASIANDEYETPLRDEVTEYTHLPFRIFHSDIQPGCFYGFGWVKPLIPIQKALNETVQSQLDYNRIMNKGKYDVPYASKVKFIDSEHGQIFLRRGNQPVTQMGIAPISQNIVIQERNMNSYIEDLGALQEATRGRLPSAGTSGKALEVLQIGDANNMSELVENLESYLEGVGADILELAARHYTFARNIQPIEESGVRSFIKIIGEKAPNDIEGVTKIPEKNIVDVKISSYLADTQEGRQEIAKELAQLGVLDPQSVLEVYQFSNIADIVKRINEQKVSDANLEVEKNKAMQPEQAPTPPAQTESGELSASAAVQEILRGNSPQVPQMPTRSYLNQIDSFLQKAQAQGVTQSTLAKVTSFRNQVAQLIG